MGHGKCCIRVAHGKGICDRVKHEKMISFKHGNNVIENFWRCKRKFPRFRTLKNAKDFINHWMWEFYGEEAFW